jgi:transposase
VLFYPIIPLDLRVAALGPISGKPSLVSSGYWTMVRSGRTCRACSEPRVRFTGPFKGGCRQGLLEAIGSIIKERRGFKLYECYVDGTFAKAKSGGDGIGCTKAGKGVKIMIMVDARGLPIAVNTGSASPHESTLVAPLFDFMVSVDFPEKLIGDKAYDSDRLDETLAAMQVEMISPHRSSRKPENKTQDGRKLRRYKRRWTVERTIAWLQNYRRLCIRWEKSTLMFQGFVHLTCSILLMKEVLG